MLDPLPHNELVFHQDEAPPHYVLPVRSFLGNNFKESVDWENRDNNAHPDSQI